MSRWTIVLSLATALSTPLLGQSISVELPVSPAQLTSTAEHEQATPTVATDGNVFLVAWQNRTAYGEIYAQRVSRDGALLDETPIPIAIPPRRGERPQVVWTGELFIVLWRNVAEIRATKITSGGEIVGEESIGSGLEPSMSCTSTRCLVTWSGDAGPGMSRVAARLLDSRGTPLLELAGLPTFTGAIAWSARSATNGSSFLVAWQQFNANATPRVKLYTAALSPDGAVTDVQLIATSEFALKQHAVASDGSTYFLTWALSDGALNRIEGQRFDGAGKPSGALKIIDSSTPLGGLVSMVRISSGYLLVLNRRSGTEGLFAFRLSVDGSLLDPSPALVTTGFDFMEGIGVAASGSSALVVWPRVAASAAKPDIYGAFVNGDSGALQQPFLVSRSAAAQVSPALATDGERVVTIWSEAPPLFSQIRTATLLPNGSRTDAQPVHLSALDQGRPAIAFNGREYLVAWYEGVSNVVTGKVMAKRLDRSGVPIEQSEMVLSPGGCGLAGSSLAIASDGRDFVVAWQNCVSSTHQLYATRVSDGTASAPRLVFENLKSIELGGIAWGGERYLITWIDLGPLEGICDPACAGTLRLQATRLNRAAEVLDVNPLRLTPYFTFSPALSRVAWDGAQFTVLWGEDSIYATRISPTGAVGSRFEVVRTHNPVSALAAMFDGASIALTWTEKGSSVQALGDLWMARVAFDGGPSSSPFQVSGSVDDEIAPAVAVMAPARFAVAYQRAAHEREVGSANRVFVRTVQFTPRRRAAR